MGEGREPNASGGAGDPATAFPTAPQGRLSNAVFWVVWFTVRLALRLYCRFRVEGELPQGAYVVAANHASFFDPIVLGAAVPRRVVFLMTEVVYRSRTMGWFYRWNRAIPLSTRFPNRESMRVARQALKQGRAVGIYPEGGISRDGKPLLGSPGAVSLVLNEGVPIVPVGLVGTHGLFPPGAVFPRPRRVTVRFGKPITPAELAAVPGGRRERLQGATKLIMARIAELTGHEPREAELERAFTESA